MDDFVVAHSLRMTKYSVIDRTTPVIVLLDNVLLVLIHLIATTIEETFLRDFFRNPEAFASEFLEGLQEVLILQNFKGTLAFGYFLYLRDLGTGVLISPVV